MKYQIPDLEMLGWAVFVVILDFRTWLVPTLCAVIDIQRRRLGLLPLRRTTLPDGRKADQFFKDRSRQESSEIAYILGIIFQREVEGVNVVEMEFCE